MADTDHTDGPHGKDGEQGADDPTAQDRGAPRERRAERRVERTVARLARQVAAFARAHGGAEARMVNLGRNGTRIVLVGGDGRWGDLVAPARALAERAVERAGVASGDGFDAELAAKVRTGPYEWKRMAGIQLGGRG